MKKINDDNDLRLLIKSIELDSPEEKFSSVVMDRIIKEKTILEKLNHEHFFGKSFWIIIGLFIVVICLPLIIPISSTELSSTLPFIDDVERFLKNIGMAIESIAELPIGVGGIFLALSSLLLIDNFFNTRKNVSL